MINENENEDIEQDMGTNILNMCLSIIMVIYIKQHLSKI